MPVQRPSSHVLFNRRRITLLLLLPALWTGRVAVAQIYAGQTSSGSLLLSSESDPQTPELVVARDPARELTKMLKPESPAQLPSHYAAWIREASERYGVPASLVHALIVVESGFNPRACSSKGACGLMQLMPDTARRFGVRNVFDPRESIFAGTRYMRWLLDFFDQNLELAVAAYNAGEGTVRQAGNRVPDLQETRQYVPRVLTVYRQLRATS